MSDTSIPAATCALNILPSFSGRQSVAQFWNLVRVCEPAECWPWLGSVNRSGYGHVKRNGRLYSAHRVALTLKLGREIKPGGLACHTCDNRRCVNPAHIWEGSASDNLIDAFEKGRRPTYTASIRGEASCNAVLTEAVVLQILASSEPARALGERYRVSRNTIWKIRNGKMWAHLNAQVQA